MSNEVGVHRVPVRHVHCGGERASIAHVAYVYPHVFERAAAEGSAAAAALRALRVARILRPACVVRRVRMLSL